MSQCAHGYDVECSYPFGCLMGVCVGKAAAIRDELRGAERDTAPEVAARARQVVEAQPEGSQGARQAGTSPEVPDADVDRAATVYDRVFWPGNNAGESADSHRLALRTILSEFGSRRTPAGRQSPVDYELVRRLSFAADALRAAVKEGDEDTNAELREWFRVAFLRDVAKDLDAASDALKSVAVVPSGTERPEGR